MRITSASTLNNPVINQASNTRTASKTQSDGGFFQAVEDFFQPIWPFPPEKSEESESALESFTEDAIKTASINILA
ncbi:hypothetical protein [Seleniivibrio sp.]|uniref:hypothetical protein n=1 Tax=Seleniivibrio sp. TaxID=2898801 RepID=UPI0025FA638C|nr:hypothetical protein [Seleniivibrio sp.]MCD8554132.1 hypothetical protein [Seleniivibrio sp.]